MDVVVVSGIFVGLVYALLASGLVISYQSSRVINFAYGETAMLVAFVFAEMRVGRAALDGYAGGDDSGLLLTLPLALLLGGILGAGTERVVLRPLRNAPRVQPLVGTFAVGSLFIVFAVKRWGTDPLFAEPLVQGSGYRIVGITVAAEQLLVLAVTVLTLIGIAGLYRLTTFGLKLRAIAIDSYAAALVGVNVDRISMLSWALAGALAAVSGILIAPLVTFSVFFMAGVMVRSLAAALVGGLTSIWGAVAAGIGIGVFEAIIAFKSPITGITDVTVALFILFMMIIRPQGLVRSAY